MDEFGISGSDRCIDMLCIVEHRNSRIRSSFFRQLYLPVSRIHHDSISYLLTRACYLDISCGFNFDTHRSVLNRNSKKKQPPKLRGRFEDLFSFIIILDELSGATPCRDNCSLSSTNLSVNHNLQNPHDVASEDYQHYLPVYVH